MLLALVLAVNPWATFSGTAGPLHGKHVVLISGDEEYRSEESLPQLGKILAKHHGARCTVLFAVDPQDGTINPKVNDNIPGLDALATADLMVILTRFRDLPDEQMKHIAAYVDSGKPIVGLRTATHAFNIPPGKTYSNYSYNAADGGFGRRVLGETWVAHHGEHGQEGTRGIIAWGEQCHPVLRGVGDSDIFGPSDVYAVRLPWDCKPLLLGQVTQSLDPTSRPIIGPKNDPMLPVAWTRTQGGRRVFTCTLGASQDFESGGLRRLVVNGCYWALNLENRTPVAAVVDLVGEYKPSPFGFDNFTRGVRPADHEAK